MAWAGTVPYIGRMTNDELRAAREAEGLTQQRVADALGVDLRTYRRWELGEKPIPAWVAREAATMIHRLHDARDKA